MNRQEFQQYAKDLMVDAQYKLNEIRQRADGLEDIVLKEKFEQGMNELKEQWELLNVYVENLEYILEEDWQYAVEEFQVKLKALKKYAKEVYGLLSKN